MKFLCLGQVSSVMILSSDGPSPNQLEEELLRQTPSITLGEQRGADYEGEPEEIPPTDVSEPRGQQAQIKWCR